jgi:hypothetical protein
MGPNKLGWKYLWTRRQYCHGKKTLRGCNPMPRQLRKRNQMLHQHEPPVHCLQRRIPKMVKNHPRYKIRVKRPQFRHSDQASIKPLVSANINKRSFTPRQCKVVVPIHPPGSRIPADSHTNFQGLLGNKYYMKKNIGAGNRMYPDENSFDDNPSEAAMPHKDKGSDVNGDKEGCQHRWFYQG